MSFSYREVLPDVFQIEDALGVCMTLLSGSREALLVDAGYGLEDVKAFVSTLTGKPVRLILTHGHYDHVLGAGWFPGAAVFEEDAELVREHFQLFWRKRALDAAMQKGLQIDEETFYSLQSPAWSALKEGRFDLGGLSAWVIRCPGHTAGSAVIYVPERALLLTGDNWNPCTWLFFPEALPAQEYRENMSSLMALPFRHVLCPHRNELYERSMLEDFIAGLTDGKLLSAAPVDTGSWLGVQTLQAEPAPGQSFVFDGEKMRRRLREKTEEGDRNVILERL